MPVTRDDVARRAGVSVATVSYVLNDGPRGVSAEKRERVLRAVEELRYRPNAIARSLRARRTRILGLVLPSSENPYFAAIAHAIEEAADARGYQVVVSNAAELPEREAAQIEALLRLRVDGLLWIPADVTAAGEVPWAESVPTVQVDRVLVPGGRSLPCDVIGSDNVEGGRKAAEHAIDLGHRRIACIAGPRTHQHALDRLRGARQALAQAGQPLHDRLLAYGSFDYASGAAIAARWAALPWALRPTAILCGNDAMAIGALSALAAAGLRVPDDVSVMGYDDVPQAAFAVPPLSTVSQPREEIARWAVERLLLRIEGSPAAPPPEHRLLPVRLVVRGSTAPAAGATTPSRSEEPALAGDLRRTSRLR